MSYDIGTYETTYLPKPTGVVYDVLADLAEDLLPAITEGNAYGTVEKQGLLDWIDEMHVYSDKVDDAGRDELIAWASSLPWDEDDCLSLTINW